MSKNIKECIRKENNINIFRGLCCDEKYINGIASDFEFFDEWERVLPLAAGHEALAEYKKELSELGMELCNFGEYSRNESCKRWRYANRHAIFEDEFSRIDERNEYLISAAFADKCFCKKKIDMAKYVTDFIIKYQSYSELSRAVLNELSSLKNADIYLYIDASECVYKRPDPHAANLAFKRIKCDEKYNISDVFILCAELVIDIMRSVEKSSRPMIHIKTDGDIACGSSLITYLNERSFLGKTVALDVTPNTDKELLSDLVSKLYPEVRFVPNLVINEEKHTEKSLRELISVYPIGALRLDISSDREMIERVINTISDNKEHAEFLKKIVIE